MKHSYMGESFCFRRDVGMTTTTSGIRTLTVSSLYREWGKPHRKKECTVPSIRLNGKWLATLGFVLGQKLSVVTNGTTITITALGVDGKDLGRRTQWPKKTVGLIASCHMTQERSISPPGAVLKDIVILNVYDSESVE